MKSNTTLNELLKKQAKLNELIKIETKKQGEKEKALNNKKCLVIGSLFLRLINTKNPLSGQIIEILDSNIKSNDDRKLLGLKISTDSKPETKT